MRYCLVYIFLALLFINSSLVSAQPVSESATTSIKSARSQYNPTDLRSDVSLSRLKSIGQHRVTPLVISHHLLGVISINIESLAPQTRSTAIESEQGLSFKKETLYLGKGIVKLRRGVAKSDPKKTIVRAAISAQLNQDEEAHSTYLRIRFTHPRKAGRVFEITLPLKSNAALTRNVSLRALSGKSCGQKLGDNNYDNEQIQKASLIASNAQSTVPSTAALKAAASTSKVFTVSTDCDSECYAKLGQSQANNRILEFFNAANTIYENDFDYNLNVVSQVARSGTSQYPTSATNPEILLDLFQAQAPGLQSADIKHLITGKIMQNNVVGLSYVGVVCANPTYTLGYSQYLNSLLTPIVIAHEIGHNFNAGHDPNNQGIMQARLGSPAPTAFSQFSKTEVTGYINSLGGFACYDQGSGSSSSSGSSNSSSSSSSNGGGSTVGDTLAATLSASLAKTKFLASVAQANGSNCSFKLRAAGGEANLESINANIISSAITSAQTINLAALNMPKVRVKKAGQKSYIWFDVVSTCDEGVGLSEVEFINVAIAPKSAKGKVTLSSKRAWINRLKARLAVVQ